MVKRETHKLKKTTIKKAVKAAPAKAKVAVVKAAKTKVLKKETPRKETKAKEPLLKKPLHVPRVETPVKIEKKKFEKQVVSKPQPKTAPIVQEQIISKPLKETAQHAKPQVTEKPSIISHRPEVKREQVSPKAPFPKKEVHKEILKETPRKPEVLKEREVKAPEPIDTRKILEIAIPITVKDLSVKLQEKPSVLIKKLMDLKIMATLNQSLPEDILEKISADFGFKLKPLLAEEEKFIQSFEEPDSPDKLKPRFPVVTFMGHVDHGKTSLLDAIRKTKVAEAEHGGITQHIGAYEVNLQRGRITFLDTPGHEAFTAMRARGAKATDIVVLVVAADDGVMPQTLEAVDHARAAGVPIIVAINKIDKPQADQDRIKRQLGEINLLSEDWGGKTIAVGVSAKTGAGIDNLLDMILLEAEMLELKANPDKPATGIVVEAKLTRDRGPVAALLVQNGTLRLNDIVLIGRYYGKIRAMFNDHGKAMTHALPSSPVEVLGLNGVPGAGQKFFVIDDEKKAREFALKKQDLIKQKDISLVRRINLEDLYSQIKEGKIRELNIILKADVQGSLGAIEESLAKIPSEEVKLNIIHKGVGAINTSDVILAEASSAVVIGFHVEPDDMAKEEAAKQGVDVRIYNVIYELINDLRAALEGLLEPKLKKTFLGRVEIRKVFKVTKGGIIAGSYVQKGKVNRSATVDLIRDSQVIFEGKIASLKRFKDDVREVLEGLECGISLAGFQDIKEGDFIEAYDMEKIARKLEG